MASPFDALFVPAPKTERPPKPRRTKGGVCLECGTAGVFWAYRTEAKEYRLCEVEGGRVVQHRHRVDLSDFEVLN